MIGQTYNHVSIDEMSWMGGNHDIRDNQRKAPYTPTLLLLLEDLGMCQDLLDVLTARVYFGMLKYDQVVDQGLSSLGLLSAYLLQGTGALWVNS